jgi:ATP-dependent RNA helicase DDX3X
MADWETDGGAAKASFADTNGHSETATDTTTDNNALDMTNVAGALTEAEKAELKERAQDAGWVATIPVEYDVQQSSRDDDHANYLKHSAVYEWDDEYGDVGPEIPELEQDLFGGDFRVRQGNHMDKLQFEVTVEGPDRLQPARSVSLPV